ncbi:hypothetical protein [Roseibium sp.]|uniref:hypothetical protein n=1 Tax=Roseibium sp. TaxID=1936156 RepID=UPI0032662F9B
MAVSAKVGEKTLVRESADTPADAGLVFIGHLATPWQNRHVCPKSSTHTQDICTVHLDPRSQDGLKSLESCSHLISLYWMHEARRDIIVEAPATQPSGSTLHGSLKPSFQTLF